MPTIVKALREFLGLSGYYRRFIKGYEDIASLLTELLKALKQIMINPTILALPNFKLPFEIECDAS